VEQEHAQQSRKNKIETGGKVMMTKSRRIETMGDQKSKEKEGK